MVGNVIWAAKRLLTGRRESQLKELDFVKSKAQSARIDAVVARASAEWERYFTSGGAEGADPVARSYHAYIKKMMEDLSQVRRHPDHQRAIEAIRPLELEVVRLHTASGRPKSEWLKMLDDPSASAEVAAYVALREAQQEVTRTSNLPKPEVRTQDLKSATYVNKCLYGWAAHVLKETDFEDFFLNVWQKFHAYSRQAEDVQHAFNAARSLRNFPRIELALERFPDLPFSYDPPTPDHVMRAEWKQIEPLIRDSDPMDMIEGAFANFSADDLHEVAHGQGMYSAPFILAIARHPLCDWASALEILHSYSASSYQSYWIDGAPESDFGKHDRIIFEAFETISRRANGIGFRSRLFKTNYCFGPIASGGKPDPSHPQNWTKWKIPNKKLVQPNAKKHRPRIDFDGTLIRPSFEAWCQDQSR